MRGLKQVVLGQLLAVGDRVLRQKRTNPREGIETLPQEVRGPGADLIRQKRTNPREGIETLYPAARAPASARNVRRERILVRGLKRTPKTIDVIHLLVIVRRERILVRGLKRIENVDVQIRCARVCQKRTNPREGIETNDPRGKGQARAEQRGQKRTNPREGIETYSPSGFPSHPFLRSEENESS